jgi:thiol-disulfide isomerase/thioredoxin
MLPDLTVGHVINYGDSSITFSDFRGKWVLLDFWSLHCSFCVEEMPEMDSLQAAFSKKMQILMVDQEAAEATRKYLGKYNLKIASLPFITTDTILSRLFPHYLDPHLVWINPSGKVAYITAGTYANFKNISNVLQGKDVHMLLKEDIHIPSEMALIAVADTAVRNHISYYSSIVRGVVNTSGTDSWGSDHLRFTVASAIALFVQAFEERTKYDFNPRNTVILKVPDRSRYLFPKNKADIEEWMTKNTYCYDLLVPPSESAHLYQFMQQDLERYFGVRVTIEKRKVQSLELVRAGRDDKLKTKGGNPGLVDFTKGGKFIWNYRNKPFHYVFMGIKNYLESNLCPEPLVDKTGYKGNVDIEFDVNIFRRHNLAEMRKALLKYGLDIRLRKVKMPVLVIEAEKDKG